MKITPVILLFFLIISVGGQVPANAMLNETLTEQQPVNQIDDVDITIKGNETFAAQKAANEMKKEIDETALTQALERYKLEHGKYPATDEEMRVFAEESMTDLILGRQRLRGSHDSGSDVINSVPDNKPVDEEPVITVKQKSKESSVTMDEETEATSMAEFIKMEILIFTVTFAAILAVIFDKQLLFVLKLILMRNRGGA